MALTAPEVRTFYDRWGGKQDAQGFYEDIALNDLVAHGRFGDAKRVFEFGCGTGRLAAGLLARHLSGDASYLGCDISATMVGIARQRLAPCRDRAQIVQTDGTVCFPVPDHSVDRVIATYVLDLLSDEDTEAFFRESHRALGEHGALCIVSLTYGETLPARIVSSAWTSVFRLRPSWVGGCRPIRLDRYVDRRRWQPEYRNVLTAFGVASEVLVIRVRDGG